METLAPVEKLIKDKLEERCLTGTYRKLKPESARVDFCSNDYLGFAGSAVLKNETDEEINNNKVISNGSTGSRLLTGNSGYAENLEAYLAGLYNCEAGLLFNSGYTANLGLFSALPQKGDTIIVDELIHASIIDGTRLSFASCFKFKHNDLESLEAKLKHAKGICYVAVESVYSMDGDSPDIESLIHLTEKFGANLIVDEAHAVGLYGLGLIKGPLQSRVFARIVTFGKALGCHGAVVLGSNLLKEYLVNFARPFIYTTAPSFHQLASVKSAYKLLLRSDNEVDCLKNNISWFKQNLQPDSSYSAINSNSTIHCVLLKSNKKAKVVSAILQNAGLDVRPILSPTVPQGSERVRICLHSFNSEKEILLLTHVLNNLTDAE